MSAYDRQDSMVSGSVSQKSGPLQFHPDEGGLTKRQQQILEKNEERQRLVKEWGWQKEETVELWEARAKARKGKKKATNLTADEKLRRFKRAQQTQ